MAGQVRDAIIERLGIGHPGKDSLGRTAGSGHLEQDSLDRSACTSWPDKSAWTG